MMLVMMCNFLALHPKLCSVVYCLLHFWNFLHLLSRNKWRKAIAVVFVAFISKYTHRDKNWMCTTTSNYNYYTI